MRSGGILDAARGNRRTHRASEAMDLVHRLLNIWMHVVEGADHHHSIEDLSWKPRVEDGADDRGASRKSPAEQLDLGWCNIDPGHLAPACDQVLCQLATPAHRLKDACALERHTAGHRTVD